jgi:hypothetical protein
MNTFADNLTGDHMELQESMVNPEWLQAGITEEEQHLLWVFRSSLTLAPTDLTCRVHPMYINLVEN